MSATSKKNWDDLCGLFRMDPEDGKVKDTLELSAARWDSLGLTFRLYESVLMRLLEWELLESGYSEVTRGTVGNDLTPGYLYAPGKIPVMLVSHCDTAHQVGHNGYLADGLWKNWSAGHLYLAAGKGNGLGADDRAGVLGIRELLRRGLRPHVLFTDGEETGAHGAREAAAALKDQVVGSDVRLLVELDRMNDRDCVFYDCDNDDAVAYVEGFGFKKSRGSFTDISVLMKAWGIAGTNLSVGYYRQHTSQEYLLLDELWATIAKVASMCEKPPEGRLPFVEKVYHGAEHASGGWVRHETEGYHGLSGDYRLVACQKCKKLVPESQVISVYEMGGRHYRCTDDCTSPDLECDFCGAAISRSQAVRSGTHHWMCQGPCKNSSQKPFKRADGLYHLPFGFVSKKILATAYQTLHGAHPTIDEIVNAMTSNDEAEIELLLHKRTGKLFADYCGNCRKFTGFSMDGTSQVDLCKECNQYSYNEYRKNTRTRRINADFCH